MDEMFKGPDSFFSQNPDLQLFGGNGMMKGSFAQAALGTVFSKFKTRMEMYTGNLGRAFGGTTSDQMKGALQVGSALDTAMTLKGGGLDYALTQGQGYEGMAMNISTAYRRGAYVTNLDLLKIARGDKGAAKKMVGDIGEVMASGRDVFGQDATADDIISGLQDVFGREGVTDAGGAAQRLRQIEAASEVLNMDAQTVAKYMQVMKQLTRNAGLVGTAGTNASLGIMMTGEVASRYGSGLGISVDKEGIVSNRVDSLQRNLASQDANQKEAFVTMLRASKQDVLAGINLGNIGGQNYTALQALNRINKTLESDPSKMSAAERQAFEEFTGTALKRMNVAEGSAARDIAGRIRDIASWPQDELINQTNNQQGRVGYKAFAAKSGYGYNDVLSANRLAAELRKIEKGGMAGGDVIAGAGGAEAFVKRVGESGYFDASFSGNNKLAGQLLRGAFKNLNDNEFGRLQTALQTGLLGVSQYEGQSAKEIYGSLAMRNRADNAGSVSDEFRDAQLALEAFSSIAGGMPTGMAQLTSRSIRAIMKEVNTTSDKPLGERIKGLIGEVTGSDRLTAFTKILSGEKKFLVNGVETSFTDLQDRLNAVDSDTKMTRKDRDTKMAEMTTEFWGEVGKSDVGSLIQPKDGEAPADGTAPPADKNTALGDVLMKFLEGYKQQAADSMGALLEALQVITSRLDAVAARKAE
jgi:hypothetical protein